MSSLSITPCIQVNPDIAGIGIWVSIYIQSFLTIIQLFIFLLDGKITTEESREIHDIIISNNLTACALLLSAIIQARTYGLSLYHANIVLILTWATFVPLLGAPMQLRVNAKMQRKTLLRVLVLWIQFTAVAGFGIWVWRDVKSFGDQPECTPQIFVVVFGYNVLVTNRGLRKAALVLYGLCAYIAVAIAISLGGLYIFLKTRSSPDVTSEPPNHSLKSSDRESFARNRTQKREKWILISDYFGLLFILSMEILLVTNTEVMIRRSRGLVDPGESHWTFGQSLAVFLVAIPLLSTVEDLGKVYNRWLEMKRKRMLHGVPFDAAKDEV